MNLQNCVITAVLLLSASAMAFAQSPAITPTVTDPPAVQDNFGGIGFSYQPGGSPAFAATGLYAKRVSASIYAFTVMDALPTSAKPFTVVANTAAGVAPKVMSLGSVDIYVPTAAGLSFSGPNAGWAWSTGGLAVVPLKGNIRIAPNLRVLKSSVSGGSGYQLIGGVLFGWGW